jgi:uncharacterized protein
VNVIASLLSGLLVRYQADRVGVDPGKVLGFLDLAGAWDPSLAVVMAGAVAMSLPALPGPGGCAAPCSAARCNGQIRAASVPS